MSSSKNLIIVPTDFSPVAKNALDHALGLAKVIDGEIVLLHVVAKDKEIPTAEAKLNSICEEARQKSGVSVEGKIRIGNIFDDIGAAASELKAKLIVMGTHGVKGMQHIMGSYAVKVITHSAVPFIVVQERGFRNGYKNLVLPFDLSKDSKQKLNLAVGIAKVFNSKVHIIHSIESDEFLSNAIKNNVMFAQSELRKNGIEFDVKAASEKGNFVKQFLNYAAANDADLIAIVNSQEVGIPELMAGTDERNIITNEAKIPVMIINPVKTSISGSVLFS